MAGEVGPMIGLSRTAQREPQRLSPTVLALAVQQEGRGLAIEGDLDGLEAELDQAAELIAQKDPNQPDAQYFYSDSFIEVQRGLVYRLARQWDKAVASLTRGMVGFDPEILTSEWATWYKAELACALAGAGEPEAACRHAGEVLQVAKATPGTRLTKFILDLYRQMSAKWVTDDAVASLGDQLRNMRFDSGP
jgi:hypothetical protein